MNSDYSLDLTTVIVRLDLERQSVKPISSVHFIRKCVSSGRLQKLEVPFSEDCNNSKKRLRATDLWQSWNVVS